MWEMKTVDIRLRVPQNVKEAWLKYCADERAMGLNKNQSVIFANLPEIKKYTGSAYQIIHVETRGRKPKFKR
jgi:hypothetical protein